MLYGDDVITGEKPVTAQLAEAFEKYGKGVVGVGRVSREDIMKYCTLDVRPLGDREYAVSDMIEKPKEEEIISDFAILGRCIVPPRIFKILSETPTGANNELQLTDAVRELAGSEGMIAVEYEGNRYDMGNKLSYAEAVVETALKHPEIGSDFREYLKNLKI